jgi:hypothetical protein
MPRCHVLRRAADIVGDRQLRSMLKVSMNDLRDWLAGRANPPAHVFLQAVDIIDAHAARRQTGRATDASA